MEVCQLQHLAEHTIMHGRLGLGHVAAVYLVVGGTLPALLLRLMPVTMDVSRRNQKHGQKHRQQ